MTTSFTLKTTYGDETRRVHVDPVAGFTFAKLNNLLVSQWGKGVANKALVAYIDDEGDKITVSTDEELHEAFRVAKTVGWKSLKLAISKRAGKKKNNKAEAAAANATADAAPAPPAPEAKNAQAPAHSPPTQAAAAKDASEPAVHWGFQCDASGMKPIIGARYHKRDANYDLCEEEFAKLAPEAQSVFEKIDVPTSWFGRFRRMNGGWRRGWRGGRHGQHGHHHGHHHRHGRPHHGGPHHGGPHHGGPHHGGPHHGGPHGPPPPLPHHGGCFGGRRGPWFKKCMGAKLKKLFWLARNADLDPVLAVLREAQGAASEACEPVKALVAAIQDDANVRALKRMARSPAWQKLKTRALEVHGRVQGGELSCLEAPRAVLDSDEWAVAVAMLRDALPKVAAAVERLGALAPQLAAEVPALLPKLVPIVIGLFMATSWKKPNHHKKCWRKKCGGAKHQDKTERKPRAEFVKDVTVPDGTVVAPGATFTKTWTVRNNGKVGGETEGGEWPEDTALLHVGGDMTLRPAAARVAVGAVQPGEERQLSVELTAPDADGRYWSYWRLVTGDGAAPLRFGPRLWADVSVKSVAAAATKEDGPVAEESAVDKLDSLAANDDKETPSGDRRAFLDGVFSRMAAQLAASANVTATAPPAPVADEEPPQMLGTALTEEPVQEEPAAGEPQEETVDVASADAETPAPTEASAKEEPEEDVLAGRWEGAVAMLTAMGYDKTQFQDRLVQHNGNVQAVLEDLLG